MGVILPHPTVTGDVCQPKVLPADLGHQSLFHSTTEVILRFDLTLGLISTIRIQAFQVRPHERGAVVKVV